MNQTLPHPWVIKARYEIQSPLGEGGFARTYRGLDRQTGRSCVLKEIDLGKVRHPETHELFEREARILKQLHHPRIPDFIDFFEEEVDQGFRVYLVQEFVEGKNLAQIVKDGRHLTEHEVLKIGLGALDILAYLHGLNPPIIHRDIKPSNVMLTPTGEVHLIDFGAVREKVMRERESFGFSFTFVGTYGYMAFEQYAGHVLPASDLYALGMTLIFLLSHKEPAEFEESAMRVNFRPFVNVSKACANILDRAIEPDWRDRYASAEEMRADIERALAGQPLAARRSTTAAASRRRQRFAWAALILLILVGGLSLWGQRPIPSVPQSVSLPLIPSQPEKHERPVPRVPQSESPSLNPSQPENQEQPVAAAQRVELPLLPPRPVEPVAGTPWKRLPGLQPQARQFQEDSEGNVWVTTPNELVVYRNGNPERPIWQLSPYLLTKQTPAKSWGYGLRMTYAVDPGDVWVSLDQGEILRKVQGQWKSLKRPEGQPTAPFVLFEGQIVLPLYSGLVRWDEGSGMWLKEEGLSIEPVHHVLATRKGALLAASEREIWKKGAAGWAKFWTPPSGLVNPCMTETASGEILVGAYRNIFLIGPEGNEVERALLEVPIFSISVASNGFAWAGTEKGVFFRKPGETEWVEDLSLRVFSETRCNHILADRNGQIWCSLPNEAILVGAAEEIVASARNMPSQPVAQTPQHALGLFFTWDGHPFHEVASEKPEVNLSGKVGKKATYSAKYPESHVRVEGLEPGLYSLNAHARNKNREMPYEPGSFYYSTEIVIPYRQAEEFEVPLICYMHVIKPHDNGKKIPHRMGQWDGAPILKNPVRFEWEPLAADVEYLCLLGTRDLVQNSYAEGLLMRKSTKETNVSFELPVNKENILYSFTLHARRGKRLIGRVQFYYEGGYDRFYSFRVVE